MARPATNLRLLQQGLGAGQLHVATGSRKPIYGSLPLQGNSDKGRVGHLVCLFLLVTAGLAPRPFFTARGLCLFGQQLLLVLVGGGSGASP